MYRFFIVGFIIFASFVLPFLVIQNNYKSTLHKLFFVFAQTNTLWAFVNLMTGLHPNQFWVKSMYGVGALLVSGGLAWFFYLIERRFNVTKYLVIYIFGFLFFFFSIFTNYVVKDIKNIYFGYFDGHFGFLFPFYGVFLVGSLLYILIRLFLATKSSYGIQRLQLFYVTFGAFIFAFFAIVLSFILPLFTTNFFSQFDLLGSFIFLLFISYAIAKFRLMNIKLVITRSILYTILVATVASFFAFSIFWLPPRFWGDSRNSRIITTIVSSILVVLFLDPIKKVWAKLTDNIFYKDKIDYSQVLQQASYIVAKEIDLQKLSHDLAVLLSEQLKLKKIKIFMPIDDKFSLYASSKDVNQTLILSEEIVQYFNDKQEIVITEELFRQKDEEQDLQKQKELEYVTEELEKIGGEMVVPIVESGKINALFVLSNKMSGDIFGTDDINFFNLLAPQIATAIEKSRLYEEVQELAKNLQKKVEEKTESLRQSNLSLEARNRYLTTMQSIINMVSRTLDLKQVTQMIADSIASELGYIGGVLSFANGDNKLRVKAVTYSKQAEAAINMLPEDIKSYSAELSEGYNLGADTVLHGRISFGQMSDFFSPPVAKRIIDNIQATLGVKTVVGVPIFSEDKIIGLIQFLLPIAKEQVSSLDIEMMTALTNQVGIVSRNLELYENLQQVNVDLHEANLHLKALDKAKSEFLSIASHQLRTPVSALKGYLSMMMEGDFGPIPEKIKKLIADLFDSASRLARTINVFLNVSRIEAGRLKLEKKPMQISDLITGVVTELASSAKNKGLMLTYEASKETPPLIYADSDKLREVILNLIDNAIKYTPTGSIKISTEIKGDSLEFSSQDTGVGIDPVEAQSLFRKFVRGDGAAQINTGGSGLGLFIAQKIVHEHEGKIWVESLGKGKGSTFKFSVPLANKEQITKQGEVDKKV